MSQSETPKALVDGEFVLSTPLRDALETLNKHLNKEFNDQSVENTTTTVNFYRFYFNFFRIGLINIFNMNGLNWQLNVMLMPNLSKLLLIL